MSSKKDETQKRILKTTWKLMLEHQGQGVRMSDIAKAVGLSRQALYLHFSNRVELMIATTHYVDQLRGLDQRLQTFQQETDGLKLLEEYVNVWGNYVPEIYGLAKSLLSVRESDEAAAAAWSDRMLALRSGCQKIIEALADEGRLAPEWSLYDDGIEDAINMLWTMLSINNWEQLTKECGWSTDQYVEHMQRLLKQCFIHTL